MQLESTELLLQIKSVSGTVIALAEAEQRKQINILVGYVVIQQDLIQ